MGASPETEGALAESLVGKLLVATPNILDPNFFRTVVLLCEHDTESGAFGIVLNRPVPADLDGFLPQWTAYASAPAVVFIGGPVQRDIAVCLARIDPAVAPNDREPIVHGASLFDLDTDPGSIGKAVEGLRIFSGYAGWGVEQLEDELARDDWFVLEPLPDDLFTAEPGDLWRSVLRRQPHPIRMYAHYPDDLRTN